MIFNLVGLPSRQAGSSTRAIVLLRAMLIDTMVHQDFLIKQALIPVRILQFFPFMGCRFCTDPTSRWVSLSPKALPLPGCSPLLSANAFHEAKRSAAVSSRISLPG